MTMAPRIATTGTEARVPDEIRVVGEAILKHAGSVTGVADAVALGRDAATHVEMGREAYGKLPICQMIPTLLDPIQGRAVDSLRAAVEALNEAAEGLRKAAEEYGATDRSVAAKYNGGGYPAP